MDAPRLLVAQLEDLFGDFATIDRLRAPRGGCPLNELPELTRFEETWRRNICCIGLSQAVMLGVSNVSHADASRALVA